MLSIKQRLLSISSIDLYAGLGFAGGVLLGIYYGNPGLALLAGLVIRLGLNTNPIHNAGSLSKKSLQTAIVLLGLTLSFDQVVGVSAQYGYVVAGFVLATFGLGFVLYKLLLSPQTESKLLSAGTAICGGTAIATLSPILKAQPHQFAVASALVFLLNIVALFTFPWIGSLLNLSQETFGAWVALAVHDTSSVVATAALYGQQAQEVATTVKLGRTLWLIPVALLASLWMGDGKTKLQLPGFVILFVLASASSLLVTLPVSVVEVISVVSKTLLVIALGLIGLQINRETLSALSGRTVTYGVVLWLLMTPVALVLVMYLA